MKNDDSAAVVAETTAQEKRGNSHNAGQKSPLRRWLHCVSKGYLVSILTFLLLGADMLRDAITGSATLFIPLRFRVGGTYHLTAGQVAAVGLCVLILGICGAVDLVKRARENKH